MLGARRPTTTEVKDDCPHFSPLTTTLAFASNTLLQRLNSLSGAATALRTLCKAEVAIEEEDDVELSLVSPCIVGKMRDSDHIFLVCSSKKISSNGIEGIP